MKIAALILLCGTLNLLAETSYSQTTKISLELSNSSVADVLNRIEAESEFYFLFNQKQINVDRKVDINVENMAIHDVLSKVFAGTNVKSFVYDQQIILTPSEEMMKVSNLQQIRVSGTVTDASTGEALPGVNILIEGTNTGKITDVNGKFTLDIPSADAALIFSAIGYETTNVPVAGQTVMDVKLTPEVELISEIVVTALGIRKESKKLGYATGSVGEKDMLNNMSGWGSTLQGKVAGVNASTVTTGAAGSSKIRIRGQSSFKGDNSPLLVINGVPVSSPNNSAKGGDVEGGTFVDGGDGWLSINPDDIENISILKGAPAAALYGSRAKDGVILVTTKSGNKTKGFGIEWNQSFNIDRVVDLTDYQYEYGQGEYGNRPTDQANAQTSGIWSFGDKFDGVPTMQFDGVERPYLAEKDRMKKFFDLSKTYSTTIALTGGNDDGNFRLSVSSLNNNGIVPGNEFKRKVMNLTVKYKLFKKLTVDASFNYSNEYIKDPPQLMVQSMNPSAFMYTFANSISLKTLEDAYMDANGNETPVSRFTPRTNPYWTIKKRFDDIYRDRLFGNISLRYDLTDWLYVLGRIGQDFSTRSDDFIKPSGTRDLAAVPQGFNGTFHQGIDRNREINTDFLIGGNREFGMFGIDLTLGGSQTRWKNDGFGSDVNNFFIRDLYTISNGQVKNPYYNYNRSQINSLYGAAEFSYKYMFYLNVTARNDWFSTLNPESNSYLYPSVTGSFIASEAFRLPEWITYAKVRGGYAEVGGGTTPYSNNLYYSLNSQTHFGQALGSISSSTSPNSLLRPLKIKEMEGGIELRFLNNRFGLDFGLYNKNTVDEILDVDVSITSGYTKTKVNVGELNNKGLEMLLTAVPLEYSNFRWESSFNLTYNKSEVMKLSGGQTLIQTGSSPDFTGILAHEIGKPLGSLRGRGYARDPDGNIIYQADGRPSSDNVVRTYGSAVPKWIGGWTNTFRYGELSLSTLIDFKFGHKLISAINYNAWRHGLKKETLEGRETGVVGKGVQKVTDDLGNVTYVPNTVACEAENYYMWIRSVPSFVEEFVYDASFIKFRQIVLSYDLTNLLKGSPVKGASVSLLCNNVFTILKHTPNIDPEQMGTTSDNIAGLEQHALPLTRSFGVNLNVRF